MAKCPNCGRPPTFRRLLAISRARPYVCPQCGSRSNFRAREEMPCSFACVMVVGIATSALGSELSLWSRFGLTLALVLVGISACRTCLPLHPTDRPG